MTKPGYSTTFVRSVNQYPVRWPVTAATQEPDRRFRRPVKRVNVRYKSRQFRGYLGGAGSKLEWNPGGASTPPQLLSIGASIAAVGKAGPFRAINAHFFVTNRATSGTTFDFIRLQIRGPLFIARGTVGLAHEASPLPDYLHRAPPYISNQLHPTALGANNITMLSFGPSAKANNYSMLPFGLL